MNVTRTFILTLALVIGFTAAAQASVVTWDDYTSVPGVTVTNVGGAFQTKDAHGVSGLGIQGTVDGEISRNQSITFQFDTPQIVNTLELVHLYTNGNYGDQGDEVAKLVAYVGGSVAFTYTLTATTGTVGTLTGPGSVTNLAPAVEGTGGHWLIENPFASSFIDALMLTPSSNGSTNLGSPNSDFGFHAMTTTATPIPGAIWLLGSGLAGLIGLRRNRRA